jgi:hypothetical protein
MSDQKIYFIAPSPLVKIALPEWERRLEKNPDLLLDDKTPFTFDIETGTRTFKIKFNTPMAVVFSDPKYVADRNEVMNGALSNLKAAPRDTDNNIYVRDSRDLISTFNYLTGLTGGLSARQTDPYGIVPFDPQNSIVDNFAEMGLIDDLVSGDPKKEEAARKQLIENRLLKAKQARGAYKDLCDLAEERIRRSLRAKHNNLIAQWQRNEENQLGRYPPSLAERLGFKMLEKEIKEREKESAASVEIGNEMMNKKMMG